ncbi:MAG: VOC family protein [Gammaproteobacteria bacterium]|jgi:predicted enzyme related to lactoylglutathione lyase|tara:strand:- start:228 stop:653 length:426 start_codon:yes stop_codon:yes gene_type:complete
MVDEAEKTAEEPKTVTEEKPSNVGKVEWMDLTVPDAGQLQKFYTSVVGWSSNDVDMGSYSDFNLNLPGTEDTIAGVCHSRSNNDNIPSQWLIYVRVESVADSAERCKKMGGEVLDGPRRMGGSNFCVIKDPAGAVMALLSD